MGLNIVNGASEISFKDPNSAQRNWTELSQLKSDIFIQLDITDA